MVKKRQNTVFIIILIALAMILLFKLGLFKLGELVTVPIIEFGKISPSPYQCPSDVSLCKVQGVMDCDILKGEQSIVTFRYGGSYGTGTQFALSLFGGGLQSYTYAGGMLTNKMCGIYQDSYLFSKGMGEIHFDSKEGVFVCWDIRPGTRTARTYRLGGTANTNPIPKLGEEFEETTGTERYSCTAEFKVKDKSGGTRYSETLTHNSDLPITGKLSSQYDINPEDTVTILGGDKSYIKYGTYEIFEGCTKSKCNDAKTGYFECVNGRYSESLVLCKTELGDLCRDTDFGARCLPPFKTYNIESVDSNGDFKRGFTPSENIYLKVSLFSEEPNINSGLVKVQLWKSGGEKIGIPYSISNFNFKSNEPQTIEITNPSEIGKYYVIMDITFNNKIITIPQEKTEDFYFRISPLISNSVNIRSPDRTRLFINSPVWVEVNVYDELGPTEAEAIILDIKYNNVPVTNIPNYEQPPIISGNVLIYKYIFQFATPGLLEVSAKVKKAGVISDGDSFSAQVESIAIITDFTNIGLFRCVQPSSQTLTFESKDSFGNYVDTTNTLDVVEPDTTVPKDISDSIEKTDTGKYKFTYDFTKKGAHTLKLTSYSSEYNLGSEPRSGVIEVKDGCSPDECIVTKDCDIGYICVNGKCKKDDNPIILYLIIGGAIIFILILIIIIVNYMKRKSGPSLGVGGL